MEPTLPEETNCELEDIAFELTSKASVLAGLVNPIAASGGSTRSLGTVKQNASNEKACR